MFTYSHTHTQLPEPFGLKGYAISSGFILLVGVVAPMWNTFDVCLCHGTPLCLRSFAWFATYCNHCTPFSAIACNRTTIATIAFVKMRFMRVKLQKRGCNS